MNRNLLDMSVPIMENTKNQMRCEWTYANIFFIILQSPAYCDFFFTFVCS